MSTRQVRALGVLNNNNGTSYSGTLVVVIVVTVVIYPSRAGTGGAPPTAIISATHPSLDGAAYLHNYLEYSEVLKRDRNRPLFHNRSGGRRLTKPGGGGGGNILLNLTIHTDGTRSVTGIKGRKYYVCREKLE